MKELKPHKITKTSQAVANRYGAELRHREFLAPIYALLKKVKREQRT